MANLLDSDIVISELADDRVATTFVDLLFDSGVAISIVTYMEVFEGILGSSDPVTARSAFDGFLIDLPIISISLEVAQRCAQLRSELKQKRKRVRPRALDLLIAATALHFDLVLVTRNTNDYSDIDGLVVASPPDPREM